MYLFGVPCIKTCATQADFRILTIVPGI